MIMSISFKRISGAVSLASIILCSQATFANDVTILNPSFESPVQGLGDYVAAGAGGNSITSWTISGAGIAGVWYPGGDMGTPPNGNQVGDINGNGGTAVSQTLTADLIPNATYTLSIWVGGRLDGYNPGTDYSIGLYGGANLLASVTPVAPVAGDWTDLKATYVAPSIIPVELLGISISTTTEQLDFDDVTLTYIPGATHGVPDAGNVSYIAALGLMAFSRFVRSRK
jgi:hypothetical protein